MVKVLMVADRPILEHSFDLISRVIRDLCYGLKAYYDITLISPSTNLRGINTYNINEENILRMNLKYDIICSHTARQLIYKRSDIEKLKVCGVYHGLPKHSIPNIDYPCLIGSSDYICNKVSYWFGRPVRLIRDTFNPLNFIFNDKKEDYVIYYAPITEGNGVLDAIDICQNETLHIIGEDRLQPRLSLKLYNKIIGRTSDYFEVSLLRNAKCMLYPVNKPLTNGLNIVESTLYRTKVLCRKVDGLEEYLDINSNNVFMSNEEAKEKLKNLDNIELQRLMNDFTFETLINRYKTAFDAILSDEMW